ncbi:TPA: 23S rRNA methyltransferase attenuation leader peptide, partial [Enterococcus faecalis]|nr:23S rRNA methyltransferase attenuation leader peptide [Enterococcus faecalis]
DKLSIVLKDTKNSDYADK